MILQPEFITRPNYRCSLRQSPQEEESRCLDRVRFEILDEGKSVQTLYFGPFSDDGPAIQRMHDAIHAAGKELYGKHLEIYLSDPRRTAPAKLRTTLRQPMR